MILILLWLCVFLIGLLLLQYRSILHHASLKDLDLQKKEKEKVFLFCAQKRWWNKPGLFVRWYVTKLRYRVLLDSYGVMYIDRFQRIKQTFFTVILWFFFISILFLDISIGEFIIFLLIGWVIFAIPDIWIKTQVLKRKNSIYKEIPYILDLVVLALRSGMNTEQAFVFVTKKKTGVLCAAIRQSLQTCQWGIGFEEALLRLSKQDIGQDAGHLLKTIRQAKVLGVSLSDTLALQSDLLRTKRRQHMEELSRTASVKMSLPLVFCIFPALLIIYLGPAILILLEQ